MGCDTHMYIEYKNKDRGYWKSFGGHINPGRNYWLFGMMSNGVRSTPPFSFKPKGMPDDAGIKAKSDNQLYICDSDEEGYTTLAKAQAWVNRGSAEFILQNGNPTWVTHPDWHSHSWLSTAEFRQVLYAYQNGEHYGDEPEYEAVLACMEKFESLGYESRIVFWFDN